MHAQRTPIKRNARLERSTKRIRRSAPGRAKECRTYAAIRTVYLAVHPFCQITIAMLGLDEDEVISAAGGLRVLPSGATYFAGHKIPLASQIHHRNKRERGRLNDVTWWLSAAAEPHDLVENHKGWAREVGFLLPINAGADGRMPPGCAQPLPTPAFLASRVGKPSAP